MNINPDLNGETTLIDVMVMLVDLAKLSAVSGPTNTPTRIILQFKMCKSGELLRFCLFVCFFFWLHLSV